jgi:hypothetical protein
MKSGRHFDPTHSPKGKMGVKEDKEVQEVKDDTFY